MTYSDKPAMDKNHLDTRIRFKFRRLPAAASFGHSAQIKELRRRATMSGLPVCGVNTPKMSFGPAISEGCSSLCEFADAYFYEYVDGEYAFSKMSSLDDDNYLLVSAERIPLFFPSIESALNAVRYAAVSEKKAFSSEKLALFMEEKSRICERIKASGKVQVFDVRALCKSAEIRESGRSFEFVLSFSQGANLRPEDAIKSIFGDEINDSNQIEIERTELFWLNSAGNFEVF